MSKKKVYLLAALAMITATVVEVLFAHPHHHKWWDTLPGFDVEYIREKNRRSFDSKECGLL